MIDLNTQINFQSEAVKALEQAATDSRVAMETADQSLSKREECVSSLQSQIRELQGTPPDLDIVVETPPKSGSQVCDKSTPTKNLSHLDKFRRSISKLELSADIEEKHGNGENIDNSKTEEIHRTFSVHHDSSGVGLDTDLENFSDAESEIIQLRHSIDKCISEVLESPQRKSGNTVSFNQSSLLEYTAGTSDSYEDGGQGNSESPGSEKSMPLTLNNQQRKCNSVNFKNMMNNKLDYEIHRPLDDSRVLQIVLTPLKNKLIFKHTKSSMLRLKNSPVKDPTHGRECMKVKAVPRRSLRMDKENFYGQSSQQAENGKDRKIRGGKRKCADKESEKTDLNTSKRRKVLGGKGKGKAKLRRSSASKRPQYNLRTRRC